MQSSHSGFVFLVHLVALILAAWARRWKCYRFLLLFISMSVLGRFSSVLNTWIKWANTDLNVHHTLLCPHPSNTQHPCAAAFPGEQPQGRHVGPFLLALSLLPGQRASVGWGVQEPLHPWAGASLSSTFLSFHPTGYEVWLSLSWDHLQKLIWWPNFLSRRWKLGHSVLAECFVVRASNTVRCLC